MLPHTKKMEEHKEAGNAHFKAGEYLKAAASYTKAIKEQPDAHVLYSNRAQAFLKLNKVSKALDDAEKCIVLAPDFVKGYHRKSSALAAMCEPVRTEEAVQVLLGALERLGDDKDLVRLGVQIKGREFVQLVAAQRKGEEPPATNGSAAPSAPAPAPASAPPANPKEGPLRPMSSADPEEFATEMIQPVLAHYLQKGEVPNAAYLQPPRPTPGMAEASVAQVNISLAFNSPENLVNCTEFLRAQASYFWTDSLPCRAMHPGSLPSYILSGRDPPRADRRAQSAVGGGHREEEQHRVSAGVRLIGDFSPSIGDFFLHSATSSDQVWKGKEKGAWSLPEKQDGIFMQCEAPSAKGQARAPRREPPCPTPRTRALHARHAGGALPLLHCAEGREGWAQHRRDHLPRHRTVRALPTPLQIDGDAKTMRSGRRR